MAVKTTNLDNPELMKKIQELMEPAANDSYLLKMVQIYVGKTPFLRVGG